MIKEIVLWGVVLEVVGVLGLLHFGMPFQLTISRVLLLGTEPRRNALMKERFRGIASTIALLLTLGGAAPLAYALGLSH